MPKDNKTDWRQAAREAAESYGLEATDVEKEVRRQLAEKLAAGIVTKATALKGGLL